MGPSRVRFSFFRDTAQRAPSIVCRGWGGMVPRLVDNPLGIVINLNSHPSVPENGVPPRLQVIFHFPAVWRIIDVIKACEETDKFPMDNVVRDVLDGDFATPQNMCHNAFGFDSGKKGRGGRAVNQGHPYKEEVRIIEWTNEWTQPWTQFIEWSNSIVFGQSKVFQIHPVSGPPKQHICVKRFSIFEADRFPVYTPDFWLRADNRVVMRYCQRASGNDLMLAGILRLPRGYLLQMKQFKHIFEYPPEKSIHGIGWWCDSLYDRQFPQIGP